MRSRTAALLILAALAAPPRAGAAQDADPWSRLPGILANIKAPVFPARDFKITDFGAKPGATADATLAIRKAIDACQRAGGGRVVVPPGEFLTGPIHLKSGVDLHVANGATLRFSRDPAQYLPVVLTRFEGIELMNYSPLIYARGQKGIAITGEGTLDGQADATHWWHWKKNDGPESQKPDRDRLFRQAEDGVPVAERVYGAGHYLRSSFIQPYASENVLIEGVTIVGSPMWVIHPVLSKNVTVRNVKVISAGPNNDGCDPESSSDVLIEDTLFDTGDDCIAIKSGRNADGRRLNVPVERVVVRGCQMRRGHGGVTIGSEVSGGIRDVFAERLTMSSPDLERGLRIKTNAMRGGVVENFFARDIAIGEVGSAIEIDMLYEEGANGPFVPVVRNVRVERMTVEKALRVFFVRGLPASPVRDLLVSASVFKSVTKESQISDSDEIVLRGVQILPAR